MKEKAKGLLMVLAGLLMLCSGMYFLDGIEGLIFVFKLIGTMIAVFTISILIGKGFVKLLW